jgi:hypothetical protein
MHRVLNYIQTIEQLRGRLIGRTPAFGAGYHGSSPCPGAKFLLEVSAPGYLWKLSARSVGKPGASFLHHSQKFAGIFRNDVGFLRSERFQMD